MPVSDSDMNVAVDLAMRAAHVASSIINQAIDERQSMGLTVDMKSSSTDLVTQYDKQCEEEVLAILREGTPQYAILSEETHADTVLDDRPTWVVDPIDGTTSFVHGLYDCCVSISLVVDKEPVIGVISAPRIREVFMAVKGRGAYCNGQRIRVSNVDSFDRSVVFLHAAYNRSVPCVRALMGMQRDLAKIPVHSLRNNGAAALDMCFVASGRAEAYMEVGIQAWDYAAGTIIVREAGGVVHDVDNKDSLDLMRHGMCCGSSKKLTHYLSDLAAKHDYRNAVLNTKP